MPIKLFTLKSCINPRPKKTIDTIELDKDKIISIHENASGTKPQTHISIMVDSQTEFISIAEEFKNCGNLSSSNLQQSF